MPSAREIRNRIRSVKNIGQITRAQEAVAASKVRRAQARVLASRAFAEKAWEILLNVQNAAVKGVPLHPLLTEREQVKNTMVILITSDRGLAGVFNANAIRVAQRFQERVKTPVRYVTVGRKGRDSMVRARYNVIADFSNPAEISLAQVSPIVRLAIDEFESGQVDQVFIAYTEFINTLTQRPRIGLLLPLIPYETTDSVLAEYVKEPPKISGTGGGGYEYEPSAEAILEEIVPRFTALQLYQSILESQASEWSARMVAMRNASDNAAALVDDYTLIYNKARQAAITNEILDIVGGAEALQASIDSVAGRIEGVLAAHDRNLVAER